MLPCIFSNLTIAAVVILLPIDGKYDEPGQRAPDEVQLRKTASRNAAVPTFNAVCEMHDTRIISSQMRR